MGKRIFFLVSVTAIWVFVNALFLEDVNNIPLWSFLILAISWYSVIGLTPKKEDKGNK